MFHNHDLIYKDFIDLDQLLSEPSGTTRAFYERLLGDIKLAGSKYLFGIREYVLAVFNEAYWICTRVTNSNHPELDSHKYLASSLDRKYTLFEKSEIQVVQAIVYGMLKIYASDNRDIQLFLQCYDDELNDQYHPVRHIIDYLDDFESFRRSEYYWQSEPNPPFSFEYNLEGLDNFLFFIDKYIEEYPDDLKSWMGDIFCGYDEFYLDEVLCNLPQDKGDALVIALQNIFLNHMDLLDDDGHPFSDEHDRFIAVISIATKFRPACRQWDINNANKQKQTLPDNNNNLPAPDMKTPAIFAPEFHDDVFLYCNFTIFIRNVISPKTSQKTKSQEGKWKWWHVRRAFIRLHLIKEVSKYSTFAHAMHGIIPKRSYQSIYTAIQKDDPGKNQPDPFNQNIINEIATEIQTWLDNYKKER